MSAKRGEVHPARPYKARDKAKVEVGVQVAQRWVLARLRNETFFSLAALNGRIAELREELNARPKKKLGGATRRELYEKYDRPALKALPSDVYLLTEWSEARVNGDDHAKARRFDRARRDRFWSGTHDDVAPG